MTNNEFVIWLAGFFELAEEEAVLTRHQLYIIGNHLNLAEAVEGSLDSFNAALRASIQEKIAMLGSADEAADKAFTQDMRTQVIAQASVMAMAS